MEIIESIESADTYCIFCECQAITIPYITISEITGESIVKELDICPECKDYKGLRQIEGSEDE